MAIDFRGDANTLESIMMKGQTTEQAQSYKCLGTIIESVLTFKENCVAACKKGHQQLFCLWKLSRFHIDRTHSTR